MTSRVQQTGRPHVRLPGPLVRSRFVERPNRFLLRCAVDEACDVASAGDVVDVHMADPGRLRELLIAGRRVWIRHAPSPKRKTSWSAVLVESPDGGGLVSLNTTEPNRLVHTALRARGLDELAEWELESRETRLGRSRIDFVLAHPDGRRMALEVKSVTLVEDGVARFPDAVTARGARHVRELTTLAGTDGWEAAILFVLQRPDARRIEAAHSIDPAFAAALAEAAAAGVRVLGRRCDVSHERLTLGEAVPAGADAQPFGRGGLTLAFEP